MFRFKLASLAPAGIVAYLISTSSLASPADRANILVLSAPYDRISEDRAVVQISFLHRTPRHEFSVLLNGRDLSLEFRPDRSGAMYTGSLSGLRVGLNNLLVRRKGGSQSALSLTRYSTQGPIVSGPHIYPFVCQTSTYTLVDGTKLGHSLDADCSTPTKVIYLYMSNLTGSFKVLSDFSQLPPDVARTTTTDGATVNFIVRVETAVINRGIYESTILHDPTLESSPSPARLPRGWNGVLVGVHGVGCTGGWYVQGGSSDIVLNMRRSLILDAQRLGQGYAFYTNTLQNPSDSCNAFLAGETAVMGKEHFVNTYGVPKYSLTFGISGGAYTSLQVIDSFPDVFDGALVGLTFPDTLSIAHSGLDAHLLRHYFTLTAPETFRVEQQVSVSGYGGQSAWYDAANQAARTDPIPNRQSAAGYTSGVWNPAVPTSLRYDPANNPNGARPTIWDAARNIYGVNSKTNVALRTFDNVGVQYGLSTLNTGTISKTQFMDLNAGIGGIDRDDNFTTLRTVGDEDAIKEAYRSGLQLSGGGGLAHVPIIDLSGQIDESANYHYQWYHFAVRERLTQENGDSRNFIMWRGNTTGDPAIQQLAFNLLNEWVAAIKTDRSRINVRSKISIHRPALLTDGCWDNANKFLVETQVFGRKPETPCNRLWPSYSFPRMNAGGPLAANILKCRLKPIDYHDYSVAFTSSEKARLENIFPSGTCDWSTRGEYFHAISVGHSYGPAPSRQE